VLRERSNNNGQKEKNRVKEKEKERSQEAQKISNGRKASRREQGGATGIVRLGKILTLFPQHIAPGEQNAATGPIATTHVLVRILAGRSAVYS